MGTGKFANQAKKALKHAPPQSPQSIGDFFAQGKNDTDIRQDGHPALRIATSDQEPSTASLETNGNTEARQDGNTDVRAHGEPDIRTTGSNITVTSTDEVRKESTGDTGTRKDGHTETRISGSSDIRTTEPHSAPSVVPSQEIGHTGTRKNGNTVVRISGAFEPQEKGASEERESLVREEFRLPHSLSEKLRWAAFQQRKTKKDIVVAALEAYFQGTGQPESF